MRSTGIVRKLDNLGRLVIPKELRKVLDLTNREGIEIFTEGNMIVLKKYEPGCIYCGSIEDDIKNFKGKNICKKCLGELRR